MPNPRKSERLAFYKWYPTDVLSDIRIELMTHEQECCFRRLLDHSWKLGESGTGCGLPDNDEFLARCCRLPLADFQARIAPVLFHGEMAVFHRAGTRWINKRQQREYAEACEKVGKTRSASETRWRGEQLPLVPESENEDDLPANGNGHDIVVTPTLLAEGWNERCAQPFGLAAVTLPLSSDRDRHARARLKEHPDHRWWGQIFYSIGQSDFLLGKKKDWRADFDFILRPGSAERIIEGKYANREVVNETPGSERR